MADPRDTASTEDYWIFTPYNLEFRGANDVSARFRAQAQWKGHHNAGTGYYARSTHDNNLIPVEFDHDHLAWVDVKKQPSQDILNGDAAEEELGLARLVSSYTLPHQNSQPGERGRQTARSKMLSRRARDT